MKVVKRDYWNEDGSHRPYRNVVHNLDGARRKSDLSSDLLNEFEDGDILEIEVRKVGRVEGFFQLTKPHKYTHVKALKKGDA